jgi:hypothetical protein
VEEKVLQDPELSLAASTMRSPIYINIKNTLDILVYLIAGLLIRIRMDTKLFAFTNPAGSEFICMSGSRTT